MKYNPDNTKHIREKIPQDEKIKHIFKKWFSAFLYKERAIAGNKIYTFSSNARRVFLKELLGEKLTNKDVRYKKEYGVR